MTSLTKNNYTDIDYTAENIRDYVDKAIVAFKDSKRDLKHFVEQNSLKELIEKLVKEISK